VTWESESQGLNNDCTRKATLICYFLYRCIGKRGCYGTIIVLNSVCQTLENLNVSYHVVN